MFLAEKFLERARTHARRKWRSALRGLNVEFFRGQKEIVHEAKYGHRVPFASDFQAMLIA